MKRYIDNLKRILKKFNDDNLSEYAAEASYFTILSFIPFTIFFLTLIKFTNIEKTTIYMVLKEFVPSTVHPIILNIIDEIYSKSIEVISLSAIIAIWSAGKGFFSLCKGLRNIYKVEEKHSNFLLRIEGSVYTLVLMLSIIVFLIIIVLGNKMYIFIMSKYQKTFNLFYILFKLRTVLSILLMLFVFLLLYKYIPKSKEKMSKHIFGAIFSSIGWHIISYFFSMYLDISVGFTDMYGSLSSIILIMLWIYACMYIILLGAEFNVIINKKLNVKKL